MAAMTAPPREKRMVIIVMGVAGSGKTTVGRLLAAEMGWSFKEGDDVHPPANIQKLKQGRPLSDVDRVPWLRSLRAIIDDLLRRGGDGVMACSALKQEYRQFLKQGRDDVRFVYLKGSYDLIYSRLVKRRGHFMDQGLLRNQFEVLEEPLEDIVVDVSPKPEAIVETIKSELIRRGFVSGHDRRHRSR